MENLDPQNNQQDALEESLFKLIELQKQLKEEE